MYTYFITIESFGKMSRKFLNFSSQIKTSSDIEKLDKFLQDKMGRKTCAIAFTEIDEPYDALVWNLDTY